MNKAVFLTTALLFAASGHAAPFESGDPEIGRKLVDEKCTSCHVHQFGGDGSKIYTRSDRMIHSAAALADRISACNKATQAGLTAQEQEHVGAYLNRQYYKFR
jgi:cytochrome c2